MASPSTLEIDHVVNRTQKRMGWSDSDTAAIYKEYLRYLTIEQSFPSSNLVPSELVDEIWHDHILHTKRYAQDCHKMFGKYLHHLPETDPMAGGIKPDITETLANYRTLFKENPPVAVWGCAAGSKECKGSVCHACGRN